MPPEFGKVKSWFDAKGFGFIRHPLDVEDIFVHYSQVRTAGPRGRRGLEPGQTVQFRRSIRPDGRITAMDVLVVQSDDNPKCESCGQEIKL